MYVYVLMHSNTRMCPVMVLNQGQHFRASSLSLSLYFFFFLYLFINTVKVTASLMHIYTLKPYHLNSLLVSQLSQFVHSADIHQYLRKVGLRFLSKLN